MSGLMVFLRGKDFRALYLNYIQVVIQDRKWIKTTRATFDKTEAASGLEPLTLGL